MPAPPHVCILGPMVGQRQGQSVQQAQVLAAAWRARGYRVTAASALVARLPRLAHMLATLGGAGRRADVVVAIVHSGLSFAASDVVIRAATLLGQPVVAYLLGGNLPEHAARFPRWTRSVLTQAQAHVVQSPYLGELVARLGYESDVIPGLLPIADYPYRERRVLGPRILWLRTLHDLYNPEMALRAFALLRERVPEARLTLAGHDRGAGPRLLALARQLELGDSVRVPGFLTERAKLEALSSADVFWNTPRVDNRPVVVAEAQASGLPVVSTRVGGLAQLLSDGENALLVESDDAAGLAAQTQRLLEDSDLAARLSRGGRTLALEAAAQTVLPKWDRVLSRVSGQRFEPGHAQRC